MKKIIIALFLCLFGIGFSGCSSDNSEPEEATDRYTFQRIKGKWYATAFLNSDNYFTPVQDGTFISFEPDRFTFFDGYTTETGMFAFNESSGEILCRNTAGKDFHIMATFTSDNSGTFAMSGRHNITFKVERRDK